MRDEVSHQSREAGEHGVEQIAAPLPCLETHLTGVAVQLRPAMLLDGPVDLELLAREHPVDGAHRNAGLACNLSDLGLREATFREHSLRGLADVAAIQLRTGLAERERAATSRHGCGLSISKMECQFPEWA